MECGFPEISGPAGSFLSVLTDAEKQWAAYSTAAIDAVRAYAPDSALAASTEVDEFDPATMKHALTTVYLMAPSGKIAVAAPWIALLCNHFIECIAAEPGPQRTLFLLDEFAQLPKMACLEKALRLYRGRGIHLWFFLQGRSSLDRVYKNNMWREIEDQVDVMQMWHVEDPSLIRDVGLWSGRTTVKSYSGKVGDVFSSAGQHARDLLQPENVRAVGDGWQILKIAGQKSLFIAERIPFFHISPWKTYMRNVRDIATGKATS